jgi:hypothetical protein
VLLLCEDLVGERQLHTSLETGTQSLVSVMPVKLSGVQQQTDSTQHAAASLSRYNRRRGATKQRVTVAIKLPSIFKVKIFDVLQVKSQRL